MSLDVHLADPDFSGPFDVTVPFGTVGQSAVSPIAEESLTPDTWHELTVPIPSAGDHFVIVQVHEAEPDRMAWSAPVFVTRP